MSNASSVTPFSPSSPAASSRATMASASYSPSTGLGGRAVTPVPVQQQGLKSAKTPLSAAAVDDKAARTPGSDPLGPKGVETTHPLDHLLRTFRSSDVTIGQPERSLEFPGVYCERLIPTLEDALEELRRQAKEIGFSNKQINAWLNSDATLIRLIEKESWWLREIPKGIGSAAVALYFVERGYSLASVPVHLRSYQVCLAATSGRHSNSYSLVDVPAVHRTPELINAAVSKHPYAINNGQLHPKELTIELYELVGSKVNVDTFRRLFVPKEIEATARYQAVLERLQKQENSLNLEAWRKDPSAAIDSFALQRTALTLDMYERIGEKVDLGTFRGLYASKEMEANPRFKAVLDRLQKQAHSGLDHGGGSMQGGGGGGSSS